MKPGMLSWMALPLGVVLFYWISAILAGLLVTKCNAPEQIMLPYLPLKWLIEYLARARIGLQSRIADRRLDMPSRSRFTTIRTSAQRADGCGSKP